MSLTRRAAALDATKSIPPYAVCAGVPAKVLRIRGEGMTAADATPAADASSVEQPTSAVEPTLEIEGAEQS